MWKIIFTTIGTHTLGEPTRIITSGFPDIPGITVMEKKEILEQRCDHLCHASMCEPGGHRDMARALILPTEHTASTFGVVFMDVKGQVNVCGHAPIGCAMYAVEAGLVLVCEPHIKAVMDTPSGTICASMRVENRKAQKVTSHNVPSFLFADKVKIRVGGKEYRAAISLGGTFFALFDAAQFSLQLGAKDVEFLIPLTGKLLVQLNKQYKIRHPSLAITRIVNARYYVATGEKKQKNIVIAKEGQINHSPCETGTSVKLAYLRTRGNLSANEIFVNESFTGAKFYGQYEAEDVIGHYRDIRPMIMDSAYITEKAVYVIDESDPLTYGFTI